MTTPYPGPAGPPSFPTAPPQPGGVPPGWYPGPAGVPQWWDGRGWGPTAPPQNDNSSTLALLAYLGTFVGGFVVPLVIRLTEGKKNQFVKHHSTEALNFAITTGIASLILAVLYVIGLVVSLAGGAGTQNAGVGIGGFVVVVVLFVVLISVVSIGSLVLTIIGAVKAGQRKYWRYPICIRFVPGAATKAEIEALQRGAA